MLRPLIRLYLVVILFVAASIIFIQLSFDRIFYDRSAQAKRDALTTYAFVLNDYLERHPGEQRKVALRGSRSTATNGSTSCRWPPPARN